MAKNLSDLNSSSALASADALLVRQGTTDLKTTPEDIKTFLSKGDILPNMVGATGAVSIHSIGSAAAKFKEIYADEVFVGASSLYVNGKKVIEDVSDTMTFTTDNDQGLTIKTVAAAPGSGSGKLTLRSGNEVEHISDGNMEFKILNTTSSRNMTFTNESSGGTTQFNGNATFNHNLTVAGNLAVSGTTTTINTTQLTIEDNLIEINSSQTGIPVSTLKSGISVNRGDEPDYFFRFHEDGKVFKVGEVNSEQAVATRQDEPLASGIATWNDTAKRFDTISSDSFVAKAGGNMTGDLTIYSRRVTTVSSGTVFPTADIGLGDECYRTDLDEWYKYNGTIWVQI